MEKTTRAADVIILIAITFTAHLITVQSHICSFKKRPDPSRGGVLRWSLPYSEICQCQRVMGPQLPSPCGTKNEYEDGELWFTDDLQLLQQLTLRRNWKEEILNELLQRTEYCGARLCYGTINWTPFGSHMYCFVNNANVTYAHAEAECDMMGAQLASIHSQEEQDFIALHNEYDYVDGWFGFWIGLNKRNTEGAFEWTDGTRVNYTHWIPGEPHIYGGDCTYVVQKEDNAWDNYYCDIRRPYVCKTHSV